MKDICWWFVRLEQDVDDSWWQRGRSHTMQSIFCYPKEFKLYPKSPGEAPKDLKHADPSKG